MIEGITTNEYVLSRVFIASLSQDPAIESIPFHLFTLLRHSQPAVDNPGPRPPSVWQVFYKSVLIAK